MFDRGPGSMLITMMALLLFFARPAQAQLFGQPDPNKATTSRAARENAIQSIPIEKLTPEGQAKANWVLSHTSIFRRMPIRVIQCDPDLYLFLIRHPDVVVNIWEYLGISHITMRQTGPDSYRVNDDIGTNGGLEFLYRGQDTHVFYVDGTYEGSLLTHEIRGRGLLVLKSGFVQEANGRTYIASRLDAFMNIEPGTVEFLTKTFQPAVGRVADGNFTQAAGFIACLQKTAEVNNPGMQRMAAKLVKVSPETRQELGLISDRVAQQAAKLPGNRVPLPSRVLPDPDTQATPRVARRPAQAPPPGADSPPTKENDVASP
ncbi:MAG: hypothetical protein ACLQNE_34680 [Thermoguttaceae bacterium]|jgi:hypothetical protein